jgi:hypothetical protein
MAIEHHGGLLVVIECNNVIIYDLYVLGMDDQQQLRFLISKCQHNPIHCAV